MSKVSVEELKLQSNGLRGQIETLLGDAAVKNVDEDHAILLKFHGTYQQDDRDQRAALSKAKLDKAWSFMVRSKMPGGRISAEQWLLHDDLSDKCAGNMRLTNRQGIQLHGVLKGTLKDVISSVCRSGLTTMGACGDVVRNTMGPAAPVKDEPHADAQRLTEEISQRFLWRSSSYADIWLDGEKLEPEWLRDPEVNPAVREKTDSGEADPIYGKQYLPRKFKMGVAIQPQNDADIFSQDVGFVPHIVNGSVEGYTITVGGGFGMSHGQIATRPFLGQPLCYAPRAHVVDVTEAIVTTQRDHGNREDRKLARMKYLVSTKGIAWFREEVQRRVPGITLEDPKPVHFLTVEDKLGWHEQGDGKLYCAVYVTMGRITDVPGGPAYKSCFREIAQVVKCPIIVTANTNLIFADIDPADRAKLDAILAKHNVPHADGMTAARRVAHACVALPTCGLSLSESERALPGFLDQIDPILRELGLSEEPLLIRMTGCPNGCGRPYNADIGFVGRAPGKYALYVGGSIAGDRLAGLHQKTVTAADIPATVRGLLEGFVKERQPGERFGAWYVRTQGLGEAPTPEHFHIELTERAAKLAGEKVDAAG